MPRGPSLRFAMPRKGQRSLVGCFAACAIVCSLRTARAEPFRLGANVEQGVFYPGSYAFNGTLVPGFDYGRLQLAATAGAALGNPDWTFVVGFRPSFVIIAPVTTYTGLRLVTDVSYLTQKSYRWTGGLAVDLESFQLGVLAGYDSFHDSAVVLTSLSFDLPSIYRFFITEKWLEPGPSGCGK
jgi:hypothetical protein